MPDAHRGVLQVNDLITGYGKREVIKGVSLSIEQNEIVALIGHNGAGKSTLLKAVFGLLPIWSGHIILDGAPVASPNPRKLLSEGVAYIPQGNCVFVDLTVRENLEMGGVALSSKSLTAEGVDRALSLFPALRARLKQTAGTLSGGEKQMLALGNAVVLSPRILLLDEPSLGLAPPLVSEVLAWIQKLSRDSNIAVLIVEQRVREVLKIARRVCVLRNGSVSFAGLTSELQSEQKLREVYL